MNFISAIYAVAGGAAACVTLLLILVVFLIKKVKCQRKAIEITKEEIDEFTVGVAAEKAKAKGINGLFVLPYDTRLEIPKSDVNFREPVHPKAVHNFVWPVPELNHCFVGILQSL